MVQPGEGAKVQDLSPDILNPRLALSDPAAACGSAPARFPCLAGYKYLFVDWHLQVFRCHYLDETLGPLEDLCRLPPIRDNCNACAIDCYRDPSVYQYLAVSVADSLAALQQGQWLKGLGALRIPKIFSPCTPCWRAAIGSEAESRRMGEGEGGQVFTGPDRG